jgi:hypothetical protein
MKKILTILLTLLAINAHAQYYWNESFEAPNDGYRSHFIMDTTHSNNKWQIGRPHKVVFDSASAYSMPNVIVTDTLNPFPANDTSVFIIQHYYTSTHALTLDFMYKLDIDTGINATLEISGDRGLNWINPITQDTTYMFYWGGPKPRLDTSTATWQHFQLGLSPWASAISGGSYSFPHYRTSDTILFRFTLISNSDTVHKDGWMMDNFSLQNAPMEGFVNEINNNNLIIIYPVPSAGQLFVFAKEANPAPATITIYNTNGHSLYTSQATDATSILDLNLPNGNYYLKYTTASAYAIKNFIIQR